MELVSHNLMRTRHFQALEQERIKSTISLENLASKQKTFRIVKEHLKPFRASRDQGGSHQSAAPVAADQDEPASSRPGV
jgi:hypothetical protein